MPFSDAQLEDLRDRADLVALIGRRITLRKAGKDHVGLCPLHGEKTPSFYVVPNKRMWHCFGCGQSGDVFKFFMKLDSLSFVDAVRHVAQESGVPLVEERDDPEEARRRAQQDELAALVERAVRYYEQKLWRGGGETALEVLRRRGIGDETARAFRLGFAGAGMEELSKALAKAGVPPERAVEAGLCIPGRTGPFDRFHGRLIIPISIPRPPTGRPVALGGRVIDGLIAPRAGRPPAKYINSPETPLYHKGRVLYALDRARDAIRKEERAVVVEGYFDVIALHQAGLTTAVAACGTSLTPEHLDLLGRTAAKEIVFLFDGDAAGTRAATRAAELCARAQVPSRVAVLPGGLDPDDFVRRDGLDALRRLLDAARPAVELLIDQALRPLGPSASVEERARAVESVRSIVLSAPEGLSRELYVAQIAGLLRVPDAAVRAALAGPPAGPGPARPPRAAVESRAPVAARENPRRTSAGPRDPVGPRARPVRGRPGAEPPPPRAGDAPDPPSDALDPDAPDADRIGPPPEEGGRKLASGAVHAPSPGVSARRTLSLEEAVAVALLKYPVLAPTVAQEGILGDFMNPSLRELGEQVIACSSDGVAVDAAALLERVEPAPLRRGLRAQLREGEGSLDQYAEHLGRVLDRLRTEIHRRRARDAYLAQQRGLIPPDPASQQAFDEQQQRRLEESRRVHLRRRERERPT